MLKPNPNDGFNASKWIEIELPVLPRTGDCRYCEHSQWQHWYNEKGHSPCNENEDYNEKLIPNNNTISILVPKQNTISACPCMDYVPGDNLAYLEWKSKRGY